MMTNMKMKKHVLSVVVFGLSLCLLPGVSWGAVDIDITFETGALPTDVGFTDQSGASGYLDTGAGIWDMNVADGQNGIWAIAGSGYWGLTAATSVTSQFTEDVIHGRIEITHEAFGGGNSDQTLVRMVDNTGAAGTANNYELNLDFREDVISVFGLPGTARQDVDLTATGHTNNDGQKHEYGWELNRATNDLKIFFDNADITPDFNGAGGITVRDGGELQGYFGDGTGGGAHSEDWHRWRIADGAFVVPEPTTLFLLIQAAALALFIRRRRSC
jgi:hypothetical protein